MIGSLVRVGTVAALVVLATACESGGGCKMYAAMGIVLTVTEPSGSPICDATVTATSTINGYSETLQAAPAGGGQTCRYIGLAENAATYDITVNSGSRTKVVKALKIDRDECHVKTVTTTVTLDA
jgi:hypothetical protein